MILYVNGDSHSAAAEAVTPNGFIKDSPGSWNIDFRAAKHPFWGNEYEWSPCPINLEVSYGNQLAKKLNATLHCHARCASSNSRIIRTTKEYLNKFTPDFIIIGWAGWEREEWYNHEDDTYYQVNASGADIVPKKWRYRYKDYIINVDWVQSSKFWHQKIWDFHNELLGLKIPHLFFNCHSTFQLASSDPDFYFYNWSDSYIQPYGKFNYVDYLISQKCTHSPWLHFYADGHQKWAEFLLPHLTKLL